VRNARKDRKAKNRSLFAEKSSGMLQKVEENRKTEDQGAFDVNLSVLVSEITIEIENQQHNWTSYSGNSEKSYPVIWIE
jgi:hypothetical protein